MVSETRQHGCLLARMAWPLAFMVILAAVTWLFFVSRDQLLPASNPIAFLLVCLCCVTTLLGAWWLSKNAAPARDSVMRRFHGVCAIGSVGLAALCAVPGVGPYHWLADVMTRDDKVEPKLVGVGATPVFVQGRTHALNNQYVTIERAGLGGRRTVVYLLTEFDTWPRGFGVSAIDGELEIRRREVVARVPMSAFDRWSMEAPWIAQERHWKDVAEGENPWDVYRRPWCIAELGDSVVLLVLAVGLAREALRSRYA